MTPLPVHFGTRRYGAVCGTWFGPGRLTQVRRRATCKLCRRQMGA